MATASLTSEANIVNIIRGGGGGGRHVLELEQEEDYCNYTCAICMSKADVEPVLTLCGHLFCHPCLQQWLAASHDNAATCPCCRASMNNMQTDSSSTGPTNIAAATRCNIIKQAARFVGIKPVLDVVDNISQPSSPIFSCGLCHMPQAKLPVVIASCSHLFCWPCLYSSSCSSRPPSASPAPPPSSHTSSADINAGTRSADACTDCSSFPSSSAPSKYTGHHATYSCPKCDAAFTSNDIIPIFITENGNHPAALPDVHHMSTNIPPRALPRPPAAICSLNIRHATAAGAELRVHADDHLRPSAVREPSLETFYPAREYDVSRPTNDDNTARPASWARASGEPREEQQHEYPWYKRVFHIFDFIFSPTPSMSSIYSGNDAQEDDI